MPKHGPQDSDISVTHCRSVSALVQASLRLLRRLIPWFNSTSICDWMFRPTLGFRRGARPRTRLQLEAREVPSISAIEYANIELFNPACIAEARIGKRATNGDFEVTFGDTTSSFASTDVRQQLAWTTGTTFGSLAHDRELAMATAAKCSKVVGSSGNEIRSRRWS